MRFSAEHHFNATPEVVASVLGDPSFYEELELPDLSRAEVVDHRQDGDGSLVRLRYEYVGSLDPMARRLLGGDRLTWIQEVRIEPGGSAGSLRFLSETRPEVLHGDATFSLTADSGGGTVRRLEGELVVALPVVGSMAEHRIVPGVVARLDIEAAAVNRRVAPQ